MRSPGPWHPSQSHLCHSGGGWGVEGWAACFNQPSRWWDWIHVKVWKSLPWIIWHLSWKGVPTENSSYTPSSRKDCSSASVTSNWEDRVRAIPVHQWPLPPVVDFWGAASQQQPCSSDRPSFAKGHFLSRNSRRFLRPTLSELSVGLISSLLCLLPSKQQILAFAPDVYGFLASFPRE